MRVYTESSQVFDFGLTGRETQENFNAEMYKAIAYSSSAGVQLDALVHKHWDQWVQLVAEAPWLKNWTRSYLYPKAAEGVTRDQLRSVLSNWETLAQALYVEAVWGYGIRDWLHGEAAVISKDCKDCKGSKKYSFGTNEALRRILELQCSRWPSDTRTYLWDQKIYMGCGILVPCEFGDLDRWLRSLVRDATS